MKTITKQVTLYEYNELSKEAQEKVKNAYLESKDAYIYEQIVIDDLESMFEYSDLQVQFDFSNCQGAGLNIYGDLLLCDAINYVEYTKPGYFTEKELRTIEFYESCGCTIELPYNSRYFYCLASHINIVDSWSAVLEPQCISNINYGLLENFEYFLIDAFMDLCEKYENEGYNYFYEIDEDDFNDFVSCMEFYEDGTAY